MLLILPESGQQIHPEFMWPTLVESQDVHNKDAEKKNSLKLRKKLLKIRQPQKRKLSIFRCYVSLWEGIGSSNLQPTDSHL